MIAIRTDEAGRVVAVVRKAEALPDGMIAMEAIPEAESREGFMSVLQYDPGRGVYYRYDPLPELPEPEPEPEAQSIPAELREQAYQGQADHYLAALNGYEVELEQAQVDGDQERVAALSQRITEQKARYLSVKAQIREQFPDNENPVQP